jgi:hypothetical protein
MKTNKDFVDELYEKVAKYYNTTVSEVHRRAKELGEPMVHRYYVGTYGEDFI